MRSGRQRDRAAIRRASLGILSGLLLSAALIAGVFSSFASAKVREAPAQEVPAALSAEAAAEPAEEAAEEAEEAELPTFAADLAAGAKGHPGFEYRIKHLKNEKRRVRARKHELKQLPASPSRERRLMHKRTKLKALRARLTVVRMQLKEVNGK